MSNPLALRVLDAIDTMCDTLRQMIRTGAPLGPPAPLPPNITTAPMNVDVATPSTATTTSVAPLAQIQQRTLDVPQLAQPAVPPTAMSCDLPPAPISSLNNGCDGTDQHATVGTNCLQLPATGTTSANLSASVPATAASSNNGTASAVAAAASTLASTSHAHQAPPPSLQASPPSAFFFQTAAVEKKNAIIVEEGESGQLPSQFGWVCKSLDTNTRKDGTRTRTYRCNGVAQCRNKCGYVVRSYADPRCGHDPSKVEQRHYCRGRCWEASDGTENIELEHVLCGAKISASSLATANGSAGRKRTTTLCRR